MTNLEETAFHDRFVLDRLPARSEWPDIGWFGVRPRDYGARLNVAVELLDTAASDAGSRTAIVWRDEFWTYGELQREANRIANVLVHEFRVVPGERVLLRGPNRPRLAAAWFATLKAGAVAVVTSPALRSRELVEILDKAAINVALCDGAADPEELSRAVVKSSTKPRRVALYDEPLPSSDSLEWLCERASSAFVPVATWAGDPAIIAFTSGTTGQSKGTVHTHREILAICDLMPPHVLGAGRDDIFCGTPSLAFTYGLGGLLLFPFRVRGTTVFPQTPDNTLAAIERHRATIVFMSPPMYRIAAELIDRFDLSSLKSCISAGETLPAAVYARWLAKTGLRIIDGIGATEMLHIFISAPAVETRPGATGYVIPGYDARIIDEDGRPCRDGELGLLSVRGPTGCRYLDDTRGQRRYVRAGWNVTGDIYLRHPDGYFSFHARADDMIVSQGMNVSGAEVESVLLEHPAIRECAVVAQKHEASGDAFPKAFVVLADPAAAAELDFTSKIRRYVQSQLSEHKCPRWIEIVDALPRTNTGKVQRYRLRSPQVPL